MTGGLAVIANALATQHGEQVLRARVTELADDGSQHKQISYR
jgi:hypothetical protein